MSPVLIKALLLPTVVPLLVFGGMYVYTGAGGTLAAHGGAMVATLFMVPWCVIALLVEFVAVPITIKRLLNFPELRTPLNLLSLSIASAFLLCAVAFAIQVAVSQS